VATMTETVDKTYAVLSDAYTGRPGAGILGDLFAKLFQILLDLISGCTLARMAPEELLALARSEDPRDQRAAWVLCERSVRKSLREQYGWFGYVRHGGGKAVQTMMAAAKNPAATVQLVSELSVLAMSE